MGIDEAVFEEVLNFDPNLRANRVGAEVDIFAISISAFFEHRIPKKNWRRGYRTVWEPMFTKSIYKGLARRLSEFFGHKLAEFPHPRAFGYIGGRNIRDNAIVHCGKKFLLSVDIRDFFPSIDAVRIREMLEMTGIDSGIADQLSRFTTIDGRLALGLPTSPVLANAVCLAMDVELAELAEKGGLTFSRYADDISFSGNDALPELGAIEAVINRHGFEVASEKTRQSKLGQAHYVTGLSVSDPVQPHVPRESKRKLRQELYHAGKHGIDGHFRHLGVNSSRMIQSEVNRLDGQVKFTAFHEKGQAKVLKETWARILRDSGYSPSFEPKRQDQIPFCICIDEAEFSRPDGRKVLALAMAVSQHQNRVNQAVKDVLTDALGDMYAAGNRDALAKRGLHFSEAHPDLRKAFLERMRSLPFEGYVAMADLPDSTAYEATYIRLLNAMLKRRLMAAESRFATLIFEENGKVSQKALRDAVAAAQAKLVAENNRRPKEAFVEFSAKPHTGLSVPDFLLGILGQFLNSKSEHDPLRPNRDRIMFEGLRDKYRLILDVDTWTEFSRRREIESWGVE